MGMFGGGDLQAMEELKQEMKEEAKQETEDLHDDESDKQEENEAEDELVSEVQKEKAKQASEEDNDPTEKKPKTPEDFKKLRLALKEKDREQKALQEQLDKERLEKARLEGYKEASTAKSIPEQVKKVDEDPEPDQEYDALNWLKWNARQQNKKIEETTNQTKSVAAVTQAQSEQNAIIKLDNEFKRVQPDYEDAVNFVLEIEKKAIKARYPNATEEQMNQVLVSEKVKLYREEYNAGRVPGEAVMRMAQAYGYSAKKGSNNPEGKNGIEKKPNIDNIKKNMKKSSPMLGSGAGPTGDIDPEALFNMSINKLATMPKGNWDKAMKVAQQIDADDF